MKNTIRRTITRRGVIVASVLALGALTTIMALAFTDRATTGLPDPLPPMTLTYEVYGPSIGVGTRSIPAFKEIVRLDYRAQNDWRETVIESPELDLGRYGTASNVGSYVEVKGNTETDYDAKTDTFTTKHARRGHLHPPECLWCKLHADRVLATRGHSDQRGCHHERSGVRHQRRVRRQRGGHQVHEGR